MRRKFTVQECTSVILRAKEQGRIQSTTTIKAKLGQAKGDDKLTCEYRQKNLS